MVERLLCSVTGHSFDSIQRGQAGFCFNVFANIVFMSLVVSSMLRFGVTLLNIVEVYFTVVVLAPSSDLSSARFNRSSPM
jgi:hypothetical protein